MTKLMWMSMTALVFLLMTDPASMANIGVSLAVGATLLPLVGRRALALNWAAAPRFLVGVSHEIAAGTAHMLVVLAGRRSWRSAGFVELPLDGLSGPGLVALGLVITSSPGTAVVDLGEARGSITVNSVDASDPEAVRLDAQRFYGHWQRTLLR